jgi:hypothetical protein
MRGEYVTVCRIIDKGVEIVRVVPGRATCGLF